MYQNCTESNLVIFFKSSNFLQHGRLRNSHIIIDNLGAIRGQYSKTHLFDVDIKDGIKLKETDMTEPGSVIGPPCRTPVGNVGMAIVSFQCGIILIDLLAEEIGICSEYCTKFKI